MDPATPKTDFIINRRAGTVLRVGEDGIRRAIIENFDADKIGEIRFVDGGEISSTVKAWAKAHAGEGRGLIIGGGDGSVLTAATEILGRDDIILGVLPFGTQNLFSRRLGLCGFQEFFLQQRLQCELMCGVLQAALFYLDLSFREQNLPR